MNRASIATSVLVLAVALTACTAAPIERVTEPAVTQCTGRDVNISSDGANLRLIGDCGAVTITAHAVTVDADSATSLVVVGDDNRIDVDFVERIDVSGTRNDITWLDGPDLAADPFPGNTLAPAK
ncbi:Protein of unknown function [Plantibacter flavus]|uniref:DUF3060 domain-containing protein n=1 Tax=Plantibacter flavus TaxID=150123 RepID=A0A3N2BYA7_9MICO|nr:DUF3060 domain-containing protein [Plantibacter flavus]ROR80235.1 hypothetical protein EDD42_0272 [Plantibacter flavus]SMG50316.1 Protein of unknown function [Plantibacter flavus]